MPAARNSKGTAFRRIGIVTIVAVYVLILVGGIVRSTGAGMGCPDWPKCFGNWVPPTEVSQLPQNYQEIYAGKRKQKNERLAGMLERLGFTELRAKISNDPAMYVEAAFNPVKTWIEYVNRLVGVLIGLFIFLTLVFSWQYRKEDPWIPMLSFGTFILVGFQGWLGSLVVSTNLLPGVITVHMVLAIVIVCLLIYAVARSVRWEAVELVNGRGGNVKLLAAAALGLSVMQVVLGTQVREGIDTIASTTLGRESWIRGLGISFYIHRSFSVVLLVINLWMAYQLKTKTQWTASVKYLTMGMIAVIGISILSGVGMAYLSVPAALQPVHLLLSTLLTGIQFLLLIVLHQKKSLNHSISAHSSTYFSYQ